MTSNNTNAWQKKGRQQGNTNKNPRSSTKSGHRNTTNTNTSGKILNSVTNLDEKTFPVRTTSAPPTTNFPTQKYFGFNPNALPFQYHFPAGRGRGRGRGNVWYPPQYPTEQNYTTPTTQQSIQKQIQKPQRKALLIVDPSTGKDILTGQKVYDEEELKKVDEKKKQEPKTEVKTVTSEEQVKPSTQKETTPSEKQPDLKEDKIQTEKKEENKEMKEEKKELAEEIKEEKKEKIKEEKKEEKSEEKEEEKKEEIEEKLKEIKQKEEKEEIKEQETEEELKDEKQEEEIEEEEGNYEEDDVEEGEGEGEDEEEGEQEEDEEQESEEEKERGKKRDYDRDFLLQFKDAPEARTRPSNLLLEVLSPTTPTKQHQFRQRSTRGKTRGRGRGRGGMKTRPPRRERLVRSEYAWKGAVAEGDQKILEDTQEILNKITPEKYATLKQQLLDLTIPNQDILKDIIFLIYEKAAKEPAFSHLYADLCKDLSSEGEFAKDKKDNVFRRILLNKCQQEFEGFPNLRKELEALDKSTDLSEEDLLEKKLKIRLRMTGNMTFIGELFKRKMLSHKIMHHGIIQQLLIKPDENQYPNEDEIETLCTLLDSIGKQLDIDEAKKYVDFYFQKLKEIASKRELYPARTRFKILDVIENREKGWPEKEELSTKTREEVRKQAIEEEKEKERAARKALRGRGGYSERGRARGRARGTRTGKKYEKVEEKEEDGWSTVGKKKTVRIQGRQKEEDLRIETRNAFSALEVDEISTPKTPETPPAVAEEAPKIDIEQQTTSIMNAFYDDRQKDDAIESLKDLKLDDYSQVLQKMLSLVMEKKDQDRSDTCSIISGLFDEKLVTPKEIAKAFEENIVDAQVNQLYFDIPKFFTWSGQMLGRLIGDKILSFNDIPSILKPVADKGLKAKGMSECIAGIFDSIKSEYLLLEKDLSIIPSLVASSTFNPLKLINPSEQKDVYTLLDKMESAKVSDLEPVCYIMSEIKKGESADAIKQWIKKISKDRSNISRKVASAIISIIEVSTRLEPRATNFEEKEKEMFEKYAPILIEFSAKVEIWSELHYFVHQAKKDKLMITIASLLKENKVLNKDSFNAWKKDKRDTIPEKTKFVKEVESLFA